MAVSSGSIHLTDNSVTAINEVVRQLLDMLDELQGLHDTVEIRIGPHTHSSTSSGGSGGGGQIDHDDLNNVTEDQHHAQNHASRHYDGGADEMEIASMGTSQTDSTLVLKPDGVGGVDWGSVPGAENDVINIEGSTQSQPWEHFTSNDGSVTLTIGANGESLDLAATGGSGSAGFARTLLLMGA